MDFVTLIFYFLIIIPSSILHEYAHGMVAEWLGDSTARYAGRLTLNPLAHIDPIGTILLPLLLFFGSGGQFMFAYAKPVPYNPYNLRNQQWGPALVGLAGPAANLLLAVCFAIVARLFPDSSITAFVQIIVYANLLLMVFNLVPIPPLDGSKVLYAFLPPSANRVKYFLERYGIFLVFILVFFFFDLLSPIIEGIFHVLVGS